jgi:hypothetical protein
MALSATSPTNESRAYSIGPQKVQQMNFSVASGDTSGTITFAGLSSIDFIIVAGVVQTAAATFSGNVATVTFVDPAATRYGQAVAFGK